MTQRDISRFGRDYLVVGNYISRVFPFLGVRFIAVNDGLDSIRQADIDSLDTSFKALLYDLYSRDLSRKVRGAKRFRAERGEHISGLTPYGYVKDSDNKKHLIPDPEAAEIVRRVFQMVGEGLTALQVAKVLNDEAVPTPMRHKLAAGFSPRRWNSIQAENLWMDWMVIRIVRDESYLGKVVFGRRTRHTIGDWHCTKAKRSDWIVVDNMHEKLVTQAEFDRAQSALHTFSERRASNDSQNVLRGKIRCGVCGYSMIRVKNKRPYYFCRTSRVTSCCDCPTENVLEQDILDVILEGLRERADVAVEMSHLWQARYKKEHTDSNAIRKMLVKQGDKLAQLEQQRKSLYESFVLGEISKSEYLYLKSSAGKEKDNAAAEIARLEAALDHAENKNDFQNQFINGFQKYESAKEITAEISADVLREVLTFPEQRLEIKWNYQEDFEKLLLLMDTPCCHLWDSSQNINI